MWFGPPKHNTLYPRENWVVLLQPVLPESTYLSAPVKWRLPEPFMAQGRAVIMGPKARQVASRQVEPYTVGHNGSE
jgi:hypothetical protein